MKFPFNGLTRWELVVMFISFATGLVTGVLL